MVGNIFKALSDWIERVCCLSCTNSPLHPRFTRWVASTSNLSHPIPSSKFDYGNYEKERYLSITFIDDDAHISNRDTSSAICFRKSLGTNPMNVYAGEYGHPLRLQIHTPLTVARHQHCILSSRGTLSHSVHNDRDTRELFDALLSKAPLTCITSSASRLERP
jgi:hypothetical protein